MMITVQAGTVTIQLQRWTEYIYRQVSIGCWFHWFMFAISQRCSKQQWNETREMLFVYTQIDVVIHCLWTKILQYGWSTVGWYCWPSVMIRHQSDVLSSAEGDWMSMTHYGARCTAETADYDTAQPLQHHFWFAEQWCGSVVKYGGGSGQGQSGQAIKLFQITPYINDSKHSTIPVPVRL